MCCSSGWLEATGFCTALAEKGPTFVLLSIFMSMFHLSADIMQCWLFEV